MKKRIGVVFGGRSSEHDVSLASAELVIRSLDPQRYEIIPIAISRQGDWFWNIQPQQLREAGMEPQQLREASMGPQQGIVSAQRLIRSQSIEPTSIEAIDVFFPVLHGPNGEDGTIQGLFEMANVPYVGCGVLASAIGMDKEMMKKLFQMAGLPVVASLTIKRRDWEQAREDILNRIEQHLPYPCFVKPANLGSSIGVNKARQREELLNAVEVAFTYDRKIVIEQGLDAREFCCAVVGNDEPVASVIGEILPGSEFSDYDDKYLNHKIQFDIPASRLPAEQAEEIRSMSLHAYRALDLNGLARVDFFLDRATGQPYINEVNTLPGFTETSSYPKLWAGSGLPFPQLLDRLIELAIERYEERQRRRVDL